MVDFCDIKEILIVVIGLFLITLLPSCADHSDTIESDVLAYQETIDSLIETVIIPIKSDLNNQIADNNFAKKDTFQLARKRIPITRVQFLVSNEYYVLDSLLVAYKKHKIPAENLKEQLTFSQIKVDSLINSETVKSFLE
ncbi:MAG: hypothetical protein AB8G11_03795 [Saprospiraceae bacterium]